MSEGPLDVDHFMNLVTEAQDRDPKLTLIQAGLLVAASHGLAGDSRSFARMLALEHALVLRELNLLVERGGILEATKRDLRTMRVHYALVREAFAEGDFVITRLV